LLIITVPALVYSHKRRLQKNMANSTRRTPLSYPQPRATTYAEVTLRLSGRCRDDPFVTPTLHCYAQRAL